MERINFRDGIVGNVNKKHAVPSVHGLFKLFCALCSKRLSILCGVMACGTSYLHKSIYSVNFHRCHNEA
jgi:hypothetical protein